MSSILEIALDMAMRMSMPLMVMLICVTAQEQNMTLFVQYEMARH